MVSWQKSNQKVDNQKEMVVTTIYPLYYITNEIAKGSIVVKQLIKAGNQIHSFSPTPKDMVELDGGELFITLGEKLEPWSAKIAKATTVEVLSLDTTLDIINHEAHEHKHNGGIDPHIWLDFDNDIEMSRVIGEKLIALYPQYSDEFKKNLIALQERFEALKILYRDGLSECKKDTILVAHDAFGYMQRRYGFESQSIMGIFANSKPNANKLAKLTKIIEQKGLTMLLVDPLVSTKSATQLAQDRGLKLEYLYTLGNISLKNRDEGRDMMILLKDNLATLQKALQCQ
jgi:zinc transport system substrate-binding protein